MCLKTTSPDVWGKAVNVSRILKLSTEWDWPESDSCRFTSGDNP